MPHHTHYRRAFSLIELLAVVTILCLIAAIFMQRGTVSSDAAIQQVNTDNKSTMIAAVESSSSEKGTRPANDLSDIGAAPNHFPDGIPANPVEGSSYRLDKPTRRVN